jgi:hypothetical protein
MQKSLNLEDKTTPRCQGKTPLSRPDIDSKAMFDIMFVHNDDNQSVEVVESSTIDFNAIIEHLREGNSIFIAPKIQQVQKKSKRLRQNYINHI